MQEPKIITATERQPIEVSCAGVHVKAMATISETVGVKQRYHEAYRLLQIMGMGRKKARSAALAVSIVPEYSIARLHSDAFNRLRSKGLTARQANRFMRVRQRPAHRYK